MTPLRRRRCRVRLARRSGSGRRFSPQQCAPPGGAGGDEPAGHPLRGHDTGGRGQHACHHLGLEVVSVTARELALEPGRRPTEPRKQDPKQEGSQLRVPLRRAHDGGEHRVAGVEVRARVQQAGPPLERRCHLRPGRRRRRAVESDRLAGLYRQLQRLEQRHVDLLRSRDCVEGDGTCLTPSSQPPYATSSCKDGGLL